jgi:hypothetical protein
MSQGKRLGHLKLLDAKARHARVCNATTSIDKWGHPQRIASTLAYRSTHWITAASAVVVVIAAALQFFAAKTTNSSEYAYAFTAALITALATVLALLPHATKFLLVSIGIACSAIAYGLLMLTAIGGGNYFGIGLVLAVMLIPLAQVWLSVSALRRT